MSRQTLVSIFLDVEDPYGALSDDAAMDVANLFSELRVRGTFPITGEKCRRLKRLGRSDVIEALGSHALGLHTNTHSVHPTTMEMLESAGWEDGIEAALRQEEPGLRSFREAFDRRPCCWAGAGFTWGPQIAAILPALGIPAYVYALTSVGESRPHRFLDTLAFPGIASAGEGEYELAASTDAAIERVVRTIEASGAVWAGVFCGHPTRIRYESFWDTPFYAGADPSEEALMSNKPKPEAAYRESLANLGRLVSELAKSFRVLGFDEIVELGWRFRTPTDQEVAAGKSETVTRIRARAAGWPVHKPGLDTSRLEAETLARFDTVRIAELSG